MRNALIVVGLCAALSGCVSAESRAAYEKAKAELVSVQERFEADRIATGRENQLLKDQVLSAQTNLNAAKADMERSKIPTTAGKVDDWLGMLGPLVGLAFPPAMGAVGILRTLVAGVATTFAGKKA